jgi:predicted TIM-barrel fold metal-dependent hydrolase
MKASPDAAAMPSASANDIVISADSHVGETTGLRDRLPEEFRDMMPLIVPSLGKDLSCYLGDKDGEWPQAEIDAASRELEFRDDPSLGTDLDRRLCDMARESVDAQVIFPNLALDCGGGTAPSAYNQALALAYNDFVYDTFASQRERFKPAGILALDAIDQAVAEAERCIERGFATLFLPCVVPWQPYRLDVYEPLWSLVEEAGIPLSFHVFSGNLSFGGEYADVADLSEERLEAAKKHGLHRRYGAPEQLETVVGMAAGMAPIVELTGSGTLERHPRLEFVIVESECGWLAWVLQAMDQMQHRRGLYQKNLPLRASDYFRRQGHITITDDLVALRNIEFTGTDCLLWGNDYPHDEGTWPNSRSNIEEIRKRLPADDAARVLCGNAADVYGFDLNYLAQHRSEERASRP